MPTGEEICPAHAFFPNGSVGPGSMARYNPSQWLSPPIPRIFWGRMLDFATTCEEAARAGGDVLRSFRGRFTARLKGPADLVTDADLAAQAAVSTLVLSRFPGHAFMGEESAGDEHRPTGYCWVVDPLDGTTNYVHGLPHYATSVALVHDGLPLVGAVYDPCREECFVAIRGQGARLNGAPIRASDVDRLESALVSASFPARVDPDQPLIGEFIRVMTRCQSIQRSGSAALNLAYVAAGRYDGYWATDLKAWDAAAGALLIEEAGGRITSRDGGAFDIWRPWLLAAGTAALHAEILRTLDATAEDPAKPPRTSGFSAKSSPF